MTPEELTKGKMKNQSNRTISKPGNKGGDLRRQAEQLLGQQRPAREGQEAAQLKSAIHELQVHQIELELQNQELQQAHLETELARRKYFDLFDLAPVGYATFGQKGEILDINLTGARLLEEERARLVNRRFQLFLTPGHIPLFNAFMGKVFSTGTRQICEVSINRNGDRSAVVRLEGILAEPNEETGSRCQAVLLNITDQKQAEQALQRKESDLRLIMEAVPALIAHVDPQGCYRQVNENYARWFGRSSEEARGLHMRDLLGENQWEKVKGYVAKALAGEKLSYERQLPYQGGASRWIQATYTPELDERNRVQGFVVHVMDIEDKKKTQEEVKKSRDEFEMRVQERTAELKKARDLLEEQSRILESFFKDTITPLVLLDRDFNFIRVNESYARSFRRGVADFPGHNYFEFYPQEKNEAIFRRAVETKKAFQAVAQPLHFPDHSERGVTYWDWTLTPLLDDEGEVISLVLSLEEVTDRQAAEDTLRNSERQIRTLADQLIHVQENERKRIARDMHDSLGASLSALKYKLEDLIHNLPDRNQRQVGESLDALILIIQETIGEARRMQNELRPPHLDDLGLLSTLSWLSRGFQKVYSRITVEQRLAVLEEEIPERLKVIIFRIVQEAMNNIGKHARATLSWISLSREQNGLQLVIGDNGAGFDLKGFLESTGQPSGMGLSIMKERADLSGGALSIVSHPGEGTMVEVWWALDSVTGVEDRTK